MHIIDQKLEALGCPLSLFIPVCGGLISRPTLTKVLQGEKNLDRNLEDKLLALLDEMAELKRRLPVAPDWSDATNIQNLLSTRRAIRKAVEYDQYTVQELLLDANADPTK